MKTLLGSLLLLQTLTAHAATPAKTLLACWDGTFAYNVFRVEQTDKMLILSTSGTSLEPTAGKFYLSNAGETWELSAARFSRRYSLSFAFPLRQCQIDESKSTFTCADGDLMNETWTQAVYLNRTIDDLGHPLQLVSRFSSQRLELTASPEGMTLKRLQRFPGTGEVVSETLAVKKYHVGPEILPLNCKNSGHQFSPTAPQKLVDFLEGN